VNAAGPCSVASHASRIASLCLGLAPLDQRSYSDLRAPAQRGLAAYRRLRAEPLVCAVMSQGAVCLGTIPHRWPIIARSADGDLMPPVSHL
jgi:hypothetical protein